MPDKRIQEAMDLSLAPEEKDRLWREILRAAEETPPVTEEKNMNTRSIHKVIRITLIAAVLMSLLSLGAYAAGFLGAKAIVIPETETEDGAALVSITQPQAVPEEMDPAVAAKVENARAAWSEWRDWRQYSPDLPHKPAVFLPPENAVSSSCVENEDGGCTIYYLDNEGFRKMMDETGEFQEEPDFSAYAFETRIATAEEVAQENAFHEYVRSEYGDYDFNYDIHTEAEAAKLEEIAAKYGLKLRHGSTLLWSKESTAEMDAEMNAQYGTDLHTDTSDPRFLTNAELCARIRDVACRGELFSAVPRGFDKVYYFDEGSFCVSYYLDSIAGQRLDCYGYNSMYATLSSGREVVTLIQDPARFQTRTHTAPDGTELTILQSGSEAFLYAYLADSFFEEQITAEHTLTDAEVDAAADFLIYSNIGK